MSKKDDKDKEVKQLTLPGPMRMVWGALAAYYLRDIINPAFTMIAFMFLMMIPVIISDLFYPEEDAKTKAQSIRKALAEELKASPNENQLDS